jgi:hypothetical protein
LRASVTATPGATITPDPPREPERRPMTAGPTWPAIVAVVEVDTDLS